MIADKTKKVVYIIFGPFRSGTSLLSKIVNVLGADAGPVSELYEPTDWNPAGYFQRPDITAFNTTLIDRAGSSLSAPITPSLLAEKFDSNIFSEIDISWMKNRNVILLKDPRFSVTLYTWLINNIFIDREIKLIRISRNISDTIKSALLHYDVKHYCKNNITIASKMIKTYDAFAQWHIENVQNEALHIKYENLIKDSAKTVNLLADFMNINCHHTIRCAIKSISNGKSKISQTT